MDSDVWIQICGHRSVDTAVRIPLCGYCSMDTDVDTAVW
jgi:hypothetical protein